MQANHADLQQQEAALSGRVAALDEEVASLKASLSSAEQQVSDLEQQLASHAETHQATLEALEKQAETLQVCYTVAHQFFLSGVLLSMVIFSAVIVLYSEDLAPR